MIAKDQQRILWREAQAEGRQARFSRREEKVSVSLLNTERCEGSLLRGWDAPRCRGSLLEPQSFLQNVNSF